MAEIGAQRRNLRRLFLMLALSSLLITGCSIAQACQERMDLEDERDGINQKYRYDDEQDHTLAEGTILSVRLRYGGALADESAWYRVRLDNERNGWYDYVEYSSENGLGGNEIGNFHDYDFTAENFNKQITSGHYDPETVDGHYILTITNSQGWQLKQRLDYARSAGRFGGSSTRTYQVP